jgi:hypothetical protein
MSDFIMKKLTTKERNALPDSAFALPKERKYIILDKGHARAAKARAEEGLAKGWITKAEHDKIIKKANEFLKDD